MAIVQHSTLIQITKIEDEVRFCFKVERLKSLFILGLKVIHCTLFVSLLVKWAVCGKGHWVFLQDDVGICLPKCCYSSSRTYVIFLLQFQLTPSPAFKKKERKKHWLRLLTNSDLDNQKSQIVNFSLSKLKLLWVRRMECIRDFQMF